VLHLRAACYTMFCMTDKWLTTRQAAKLAGYHRDHILRLIADGNIKATKWGRDWQVDQASLLAHVRKVEKLGAKRGPKAGA
jgi:excisionase family DNA binding protein